MLPSTGWSWPERALAAGAAGSFGIAMLHVAIALVGGDAYAYFGAADLARADAVGSIMPALLTVGAAAVFALFGAYALAAVRPGRPILPVRWLPWPVLGLRVITAIYLLRGGVLITQSYLRLQGEEVPARLFVFSAVALALGVLQLWGILGLRRGAAADVAVQ
jgi:hypothetical protein